MKATRHRERAQALREQGRWELVEAALSEALEAALAEEDLLELTRVRFLLGELLFAEGRGEEALPFLQAVVRTERADGLVDDEVKRSAALLRELRSGEG